MRVALFDCEHEKELEKEINDFLNKNIRIIDIKYQISHFFAINEQIYSYSAMIIYENNEIKV